MVATLNIGLKVSTLAQIQAAQTWKIRIQVRNTWSRTNTTIFQMMTAAIRTHLQPIQTLAVSL